MVLWRFFWIFLAIKKDACVKIQAFCKYFLSIILYVYTYIYDVLYIAKIINYINNFREFPQMYEDRDFRVKKYGKVRIFESFVTKKDTVNKESNNLSPLFTCQSSFCFRPLSSAAAFFVLTNLIVP